ncbi:MAG: tandem-95 repeat protein, partial [Planctomycetales bacterium]|nr:tandem-95 repeat protein [Planctomycetales bacterium]
TRNDAELDGLVGDEDTSDDGVFFGGTLTPGGHIPVAISASTEGFIDAWIDMDGDGTFDAVRDQVFQRTPVTRGLNELTILVPDDAALGDTYARFRFSTIGGLAPTGRANDGEVEDYPVTLFDVDAPVATNDSYTVDEDAVLTVNADDGLLANDSANGGGDLTAQVVTGPANGTLTLNVDGSFVYTPSANFFGSDSFTYRAHTSILGSNVATVSIQVASQPDSPIAADDSATTAEDTPVTINLVANDVDPDGALNRASVNITTQPAHGTVTVNDQGVAVYTPAANYNGTDTFRYTVGDAENAVSAPATVTIQITSVNDVPIANADRIFVRQGVAQTYDLLENDVDVDGTLNRQSVVITSSPKSGTIRFNADGTIVFTPDPVFQGVDTFRYTVRDNSGATSNQAIVTLTVSGSNFAPVAENDTATVAKNASVTIDVLDNDSDADGTLVAGSIAITLQPQHGTVATNLDGTVVYTPSTDYVGEDTFRYTVKDEFNAVSNEATVSVTVAELGQPWQNQNNPLDVNDDGFVVPFDVLLVINEINLRGSRELEPPPITTEPFSPPPFIDVNGDGFLSPVDALIIINYLNTGSSQLAAKPALAAVAAPAQDIGAALDIVPDYDRQLVGQAVAVDQAVTTTVRPIAEAELVAAWDDDDAWESYDLSSTGDLDDDLLGELAGDGRGL